MYTKYLNFNCKAILQRKLKEIKGVQDNVYLGKENQRFKQEGGIKQKGELNVGKFLLSCTRC